MKLRFGIVFALLATLVVGANVGGVGQAKAQFGGSPLPHLMILMPSPGPT
jgi:hypothetical protein